MASGAIYHVLPLNWKNRDLVMGASDLSEKTTKPNDAFVLEKRDGLGFVVLLEV